MKDHLLYLRDVLSMVQEEPEASPEESKPGTSAEGADRG
jgi:hypothetical protein